MIRAQVQTSDELDRLVIVPINTQDRLELLRVLHAACPGIRVTRSAEGVVIAGQDADCMLAPLPVDLSWHPDARQFAENRARAKAAHDDIRGAVQAVVMGGRAAAEVVLSGVEGLDALDDHQWVNVASMTLPGGAGLCVFDEQGAGKTVTLIHAFDVLVSRDEVDFALIVAPKSMVPEWKRDFDRFKGDTYSVELLAGSRREKSGKLRGPADVLVTNFETAVNMEEQLRAKLRRHGVRGILVVDESFYIKCLDARRTRALKRLREFCGRAFVLCGTPAPNAPHDLVQQFSLVDFGLTFAGVRLPNDRSVAAPLVQAAIDQRGAFVRHLKRDVLPNLPEKRFTRLLLDLEPVQERLYLSALDGLITDLRSTSDDGFQRNLPSFLARRAALLQICSNPAAVADTYSETPTKLLALDELLRDLVEVRREKVVIWSFYRASIEAIAQRYERYGVARYDGSVDDVAERRERVRRFQEDDLTMLFVANPAAAGAGLTLHRSAVAIYESMSNQAAHYLQSLDRIHRRGQGRQVEYIILLCDGTVEVNEYASLQAKERAAQDLLRDAVSPPPTREIFLSELLQSASQFGVDHD